MDSKWKWVLGITLTIIVLIVPLVAWNLFLPQGRYGMMPYGYGWHMPMMYGGGMMGFGMMFLTWLILVSLLVTIVLGIAWLFKTLKFPK
ncbi:MAG: hypothetical protein L0287_29410 [Anaerolineae bacterium]|nr:hypothetical protein [Anaerolineae bacterium]MCI0611201.1 hypothetical protein [Anaerolineae bacterium]